MNEKNIENLKARLMQLGFAASVEMELRCRICFSPSVFELIHIDFAGADSCKFMVRLEKGEKDLYGVMYYSASLRKEVKVPKEFVLMDQRMSAVNWKALTAYNSEQLFIDKASVSEAFGLLKEIELLGSDGDVLKFKHWVDTPLEILMPNLSGLKNRYEISERFYLLDEAHVIPFAEANRFLRAKWMEREMLASKKLLVKNEDKSAGGIGKRKLLIKNTRKPGRQGLHEKI